MGFAPTVYSLETPAVVIRPALLRLLSANQSNPSCPTVMPSGPAKLLELMRTTLFSAASLAHMFPSDPSVTSVGEAEVRGISVMPPAVVARPSLLLLDSANQRRSSGPAAMPSGWLSTVGIVYS